MPVRSRGRIVRPGVQPRQFEKGGHQMTADLIKQAFRNFAMGLRKRVVLD